MKTNPKDMLNDVKRQPRSRAFQDEQAEAEQSQTEEVEQVETETEDQAKPRKLKTKLSEYGDSKLKRTTIELPAEVLKELKLLCLLNDLKMRDTIFEAIVKEVNRLRK